MTDGLPNFRWAIRALALLLTLLAIAPLPAHADPADIDAAARGVVRVVVIDREDGEIYPVSHGTGFAVSPERIVTNAHVISEARENDKLSIGIVPSDGENAVYARIVSVSPRNDLALLATTSPMRLPPLTIAGNPNVDSGSVTSVGYPMNVDRAQGLSMEDIFQAQPPVKATGFLSGRRPSREFDTLLHTAPIARGNSGGPLLDDCGRVVGVNSFGAESGGADAEFYFAVSTRELLPFLRANDISPPINALPCRSLADLDEAERDRLERERAAAASDAREQEIARQRRRSEVRAEVQFEIFDEREVGMALAGIFLLVAFGAGATAYFAHERENRQARATAAGIAAVAVIAALIAWLTRPDFRDIEDRLQERLREELDAEDSGRIAGLQGELVCTLDLARSRVTGPAASDVPFAWDDSGCVNGRTQYGLAEGNWMRVFVPGTEEAVSINQFDPQTREYRVERYLLGRDAMQSAREARGEYQAPECGGGIEAARELGARQSAIVAVLPDRPNERLVYTCREASATSGNDGE